MLLSKEGLTRQAAENLAAKGYVVEVDGDSDFIKVYKPKDNVKKEAKVINPGRRRWLFYK